MFMRVEIEFDCGLKYSAVEEMFNLAESDITKTTTKLTKLVLYRHSFMHSRRFKLMKEAGRLKNAGDWLPTCDDERAMLASNPFGVAEETLAIDASTRRYRDCGTIVSPEYEKYQV